MSEQNIIKYGNETNLVIKNIKIIKYDPKLNQVIESQPILLLDISGSMKEMVGNKKKIDMLREVVAGTITVRKYVFSDNIREIDSYIPDPQASTNLFNAFSYLSRIINRSSKLVLVSDGIPDDPENSMKAARQLDIPVDTLYIGNPCEEGERFMQLLAKMTGGQTLTAETLQTESFQKQLSQGITALLTGLTSEEQKDILL